MEKNDSSKKTCTNEQKEDLFWGDLNPEHKAVNIYTREEFIDRFGKEPTDSEKLPVTN